MRLTGTVRDDRPLLVVALDQEARQLGTELPVLITGVGKVCAAVSVATLLATVRPAYVVNLGTAGGLRHGLDGIHEVGTVVQHDFDDDSVAAIVGHHFGGPIVLGEGLVLATGDRFVAGGRVRDQLAKHADLVDMEGYAVAAACLKADIRLRLVKLVSDDAGDEAGHTWGETVADHAHTLAAWVADHL